MKGEVDASADIRDKRSKPGQRAGLRSQEPRGRLHSGRDARRHLHHRPDHGLVGPRVLNYLSDSKVKAAKIQIESLSAALDLFYLDNGRYPAANEGLTALVQRPSSDSAWNGPYLKTNAVPADPWGHPYLYKVPGDHAPYEIASLAPPARREAHRPPRRSRVPIGSSIMDRENGFTLIEVVCVLAIVGLLAMIALPAMPIGTTQSRLAGYAVEVATLLKADRTAAIRRGQDGLNVAELGGASREVWRGRRHRAFAA